eukprot:714115-Rhodomonas_salina.1
MKLEMTCRYPHRIQLVPFLCRIAFEFGGGTVVAVVRSCIVCSRVAVSWSLRGFVRCIQERCGALCSNLHIAGSGLGVAFAFIFVQCALRVVCLCLEFCVLHDRSQYTRTVKHSTSCMHDPRLRPGHRTHSRTPRCHLAHTHQT